MIFIFLLIAALILAIPHFAVYLFVINVFTISSKSALISIRVSFIVLWLSFLLTTLLTHNFEGRVVDIFYYISAVWLGTLTLLFISSIIYGIILLTFKWSNLDLPREWVGILLIIIAIGASVYSVINARQIVTKRVQISLTEIPTQWIGRKVVWISDIHLGRIYGERYMKEIVERIRKEEPYILVIGGDLFDGVEIDYGKAISPISEISPVGGKYFITGNHEEFRASTIYTEPIEKAGITYLKNKFIEIDGIKFIGVDDRDSTNKSRFEEIMSDTNDDTRSPTILLKHQPSELDIAEKHGVDLQISGHTHKAQIWPLSFISSLIYKGYDYGLKDYKDMQVLTSSGVGTWGPPMRLGSKSEIVVIDFR